MAQNKAVETFNTLKDAVARMSGNVGRVLTMAHVFQHTFITRLVRKDKAGNIEFKAELQQAETWEAMNAEDFGKAIAELPFKQILSETVTAKTLTCLYLITVKHPLAKDASKDMIALAKLFDSVYHFKELELPTKASKTSNGAKMGKGL